MALMLSEVGEVYVLPELLCIKRQHSQNMTRDKQRAEQAFEKLKAKHNLAIDARIRNQDMAAVLGGLVLDESR
jgi:hypothetical protein